MQFKVRILFSLLAALAAGSPLVALAQAPIRLIIGGPAGGNSDLAARLASEKLSQAMGTAVVMAFASAEPGGTVLLAPACASFDMFRDYADRGRIYKDEVRRLAKRVGGRREQ